MGCFRMSCGASGLSIRDGEETYFFPIMGPHAAKDGQIFNMAHTYINDLCDFLAPPILGKYNDYGSIDCIDEEFYKEYTELFEKIPVFDKYGEKVAWEIISEEHSRDKGYLESICTTIERNGCCGDGLSVEPKAKWCSWGKRGIGMMLVKKSFVDKLMAEWKVPHVNQSTEYIIEKASRNEFWGEIVKHEKYKEIIKVMVALNSYFGHMNIQIKPSNYAGQSENYMATKVMSDFLAEHLECAYKEYAEDFDSWGYDEDEPVSKEEYFKRSDTRFYYNRDTGKCETY